ncbi:YgaP family membrane protein [Roseovarius aestuariivivens]|uniref:YgaP family membrane protein n=1 Tax=Roseovarius aestuariivivens TaxID=1888910 RepID=UPI001081CAF1|nr:DUF2892 domain-containing protein [Roseovarius aestuariivivens]
MSANVGTIDRILRAVLGLALIYFAFFSGLPAFESQALKFGATVIAFIMLIVAPVRVCPVYSILGIKTCRN